MPNTPKFETPESREKRLAAKRAQNIRYRDKQKAAKEQTQSPTYYELNKDTISAKGKARYKAKKDQGESPDLIYVVLGHSVNEKDSLVVYAGFDPAIAQEYADMADNVVYYTELQTWKDGERDEG